jgi:uncharacterized protein
MEHNRSSVWLSEEELGRTEPVEVAAFRSPIPTQIVSNGEYTPAPQTEQQRRVEARFKELADTYGHRLGMDRRQFLKTSCGMAAAFLAMNQVFGPIFDVTEAEAAEPERAHARSDALKDQFIFDVQTHFVRDNFEKEGLLSLGKFASEHWNPTMLKDVGLTLQRYKFQNYVKEIFLDSDTKVALLSSSPSDDPAWELLSNDQMAAARTSINQAAGSRRLLCHSVITPGKPGWLEEVERGIAEVKPESWKGYTIGDPFGPSKFPWRLDDEKLMYPFYEKIVKAGIPTVCIHKGLLPADYEKSLPELWKYARVDDVGKAAKDWPQVNFIIYHSALRPFVELPERELAEFEQSGYIQWTTDLARIPAQYSVTNVYAELGTAFANSAVTHPRLSAALIGQLVDRMGVDHVVWGTDSVWYGSPQWQIEALRRLEIPDDMLKQQKWQPLGGPDSTVKSTIFGLNSARLYHYDVRTQYKPFTTDKLSEIKAEYEHEGVERNNVAYGFIAKQGA